MSIKLAIDTSVWIESLCPDFEYYDKARVIIDAIDEGRVFALITHLTATEILYVSYRLYRETGLVRKDALDKAIKLFNYMVAHPYITVYIDDAIAKEAALIKIKYRVALADAYILSLARSQGTIPVFCKVEKELERTIDHLREEFNIMFLSQDWSKLSKFF